MNLNYIEYFLYEVILYYNSLFFEGLKTVFDGFELNLKGDLQSSRILNIFLAGDVIIVCRLVPRQYRRRICSTAAVLE